MHTIIFCVLDGLQLNKRYGLETARCRNECTRKAPMVGVSLESGRVGGCVREGAAATARQECICFFFTAALSYYKTRNPHPLPQLAELERSAPAKKREKKRPPISSEAAEALMSSVGPKHLRMYQHTTSLSLRSSMGIFSTRRFLTSKHSSEHSSSGTEKQGPPVYAEY